MKRTGMTGGFGVMLLSAFVSGSLHSSADEAISITVRPTVATAGGNAQLKVLVERNERNRALIWEVDGPNFYRSSARELHGSLSPRAYMFIVKDLPAGEYEVRATVRRNDRSESTDRGAIKVVGGPEILVMP